MKAYLTAFVAYDIATKESKLILPPKNRQYAGGPLYSWDGKTIVFTCIEGDNSNICVMDADGGNFQQLTHDYSDGSTIDTYTGKAKILKFNTGPSFSPDGKRIIFMRAGIKRERSFGRGEMLSKWDIYEMELETRKIRRLTDHQFYDISRPYYMPDGQRFIFWAMSPGTFSVEELKRYQNKYQDNWIFIMDGEQKDLKPAIVHGSWTSQPSVTRYGAILFLAKTNEIDGLPKNPYNYDLFIMKEGKINRITRKAGYIDYSSISLDGKRILFATTKRENGKSIVRSYVVNHDGTGLLEVTKAKVDTEQVERASYGVWK